MNTDIYTIYQEALAFAIEAHGDQMYGDLPYEFHLRDVLAELEHANVNGAIDLDKFIAGACHDLLEDTDTTYEQLVERYGKRVADIVWACTGVGKNRKEKQASIIVKLNANHDAIDDKMADRNSNMRNCIRTGNRGLFKMYQKECGLYDPLFKLGSPIMYAEFVRLSNYTWG